MYAVVAPGLAAIYKSYADVERIHKLYPYPKWKRFEDANQASLWLQRNKYSHKLSGVFNYGNTFADTYVSASYKILNDAVYYIVDTRRVGMLRIMQPDVITEYSGSKIYMKLPNIRLNPNNISAHMSAIHNLLTLLGEYVDVNLTVPNYSIWYCLTSYDKDDNRTVKIVRDLINSRLCKVAVTLRNNIPIMEEVIDDA